MQALAMLNIETQHPVSMAANVVVETLSAMKTTGNTVIAVFIVF